MDLLTMERTARWWHKVCSIDDAEEETIEEEARTNCIIKRELEGDTFSVTPPLLYGQW